MSIKWMNARTAAEVHHSLASDMNLSLFIHLHTPFHTYMQHTHTHTVIYVHILRNAQTHTRTHKPFHFAETVEVCPFRMAHSQPLTAHYQCVTPGCAEKGEHLTSCPFLLMLSHRSSSCVEYGQSTHHFACEENAEGIGGVYKNCRS